jgi:hypothetical protein
VGAIDDGHYDTPLPMNTVNTEMSISDIEILDIGDESKIHLWSGKIPFIRHKW